MNQPPSLTIDLSRRVRSLSLDKAELRGLLEKLQERCLAAGDIEVASFQQFDQTLAIYEENKKILKEGFKLYLVVTGSDGIKLYGEISTIFDSPNYPDSVQSVFFDSSRPLRVSYSYTPKNQCVLNLDFSRPEVLNFTLLPSQETPNDSYIAVQGSEATWVNGVYYEFDQFIKTHPSTLEWLHKHSSYDFLLFIIGLPVGFWCCYRATEIIQNLSKSAFFQAAIYTYIFLLALVVFRILFHYARWIWPLVEYQHPKNQSLIHRFAWSTIAFGVVSSLLYDIFKSLWKA